MARTAYLNLDGEVYSIEVSAHAVHRSNNRFEGQGINSDFIIGRLEVLLMNPTIVDLVLNEIRYGESFILEDHIMGISLAIAHNYYSGEGSLSVITIRNFLSAGEGQKIVDVFKRAGEEIVELFTIKNGRKVRLEVVA